MRYIVTHPGRAHADEFIACCLAMSRYRFPLTVVRREPNKQELDDPNVLVLDVGLSHDPDRSNFDHHQENGMSAAFVLFAEDEGIIDKLRRCFTWVDYINDVDTQGPLKTWKALGLDASAMRGTYSPIDGGLLALFANDEARRDLYPVMKRLGDQWLKQANAFEEQWQSLMDARLDDSSSPEDLLDSPDVVCGSKVVNGLEIAYHNMPWVGPGVWSQFVNEMYPEAAINICPDDRGDGWCLFRRNDHPAVDFAKLEGHTSILFAHKAGFIAKTKKRSSFHEVMELIGLDERSGE